MFASRIRRILALALALTLFLSIFPAVGETYPLTAYTTASLRLRQQPSSSATVLLTIPAGDMVIITGESGSYYIAAYEGVQGYALKQYLNVITGSVSLPAVTPAPEAASASSAYPLLYSGSQGDAVKALQNALKELGFYSSSVDGSYGSGTRSAVMAFQKMNELSQSGTADAATQTLLYEGSPKNSKGKATTVKTVAPIAGAVISSGSKGEAVTKLQTRLKELGYYTGSIDGAAGSGTISAVKAFQKKNGLTQTGIADAATQALLYSTEALAAKATATPKAAPTPTPIPTNAPASAAATFPFATYTTASVNLRKEASTSSTRLLTIPKGAEISVLAISGDYLRVTYSGKTGYIVSEYAVVPSQYAPGKALATDSEAEQNYAYLQSGSTGKNVTVLQEALKELEFYSGVADGNYGTSTVAAVKAFQKKNGIKQDGIATPEVQKLIFEGKPYNARGKKTAVNTLPNHTVAELTAGKKGDQVTELQNNLKLLGFYTASPTGVYDNATVSAVKKFQTAHSLTVDGIAGRKTLQLLGLLTASAASSTNTAATAAPLPTATPLTAQNVIVLRSGTQGLAVTQLQNRLMELGYYTCVANGVYDSDEIAAVKAFQQKNGLTVDGVAGLATQQALYSASAIPAMTAVPAAASPTPIVAATAAPVLQTLKSGSSGELVSALQTRLKELGYFTGTVDGQYGTATAQAVMRFQKANGLSADGVAGSATLNKLYVSGTAVAAVTAAPTQAPAATSVASISATLLRTGDSGAAVKAMQQRLVQLGYLSAADGIYGPRTYNAVVAFQKRNGLTADGVAGTMTLNRLTSSSAVAATGTVAVTTGTTSGSTSSSASFVAPKASQVKYANWYSVIRDIARKMPDVVIYDPESGLYFNLHMFSFGKHADSETPTAADTAILNQVVGVNTWTPKFVWVVFPDGQVYIGSIHSHGHEVDHTPNNDLEGHICLHFPRVMSEAEQTGPYAVSHQKEINWGWELTQAMAKQ